MTDLGRVFGNRVMELRFRTAEAEDLQVGEMLVVEETGVKFLVRTMDVLFGADSEEDDWMEREAGIALREGQAQGYDYEGVKADLYKVGVCTPLGCLKDGSYRKTWQGREDNEHLAELLGQLDSRSPRYADELYGALAARYAQAAAANA